MNATDSNTVAGYDFRDIEARWQHHWEQQRTFAAPNPGDEGFDPGKPKFYVLDMFPYPSGVGLHVGHPLGYIATDIVARYKRMKGFNVLHPMGFDAFGLPAEQFAVEHGVHPRVTTEQNIANMIRQLKRLGLSYDWDRCLSTTDVGYYKWTQWIFLQLYHSWFDPIQQKARPIADLVTQLENEKFYVGFDGQPVFDTFEGLEALDGDPVGARKWHELSQAGREAVLDGQRLAYQAEIAVNWCPALGTVLANEEVTSDGRSERGNHPVFKRPLKQWMLRITAYAERLIEDLALVDWPEPIKLMQRNWIGKSEGAMVDFPVRDSDETIRVFTTRPDTLFGATYMVLAPEHPMVEVLTTKEQKSAVQAYVQQAANRSDVDRTADIKTKTGVFTGGYAINPLTGKPIPVWIADYVLMGYGTGAIMAVPAHDQRDFEFARAFGLPIVAVVLPTAEQLNAMMAAAGKPVAAGLDAEARLVADYLGNPGSFPAAFTGDGLAVHCDNGDLCLNEMTTPDAKAATIRWLLEHEIGEARVQYKLRDWLFSRQRYWGEPFPILHAPDGRVVAVDETDLPVTLPAMDDFRPRTSDDPNLPPQPPLARAPENWRIVRRDGVAMQRELNTMPQWAGSCWYYLRFLDPHNSDRFADPDVERYWMTSTPRDERSQSRGFEGIDLYVGGAEHAVLHLLYARFWHKVLYDLGHVSTPEPFGRLFNQGYIQAHAYTDARGVYVPAAEVEEKDGQVLYQGQPVRQEFGKMGKSLKNAVTPDEVCEQFGCDTLRLYEMYLGPLDQSKLWNTRDITGPHRFLQRLWRCFVSADGQIKVADVPADPTLRKLLHKTIKRVTDDLERMSFNTAIAALIELSHVVAPLERMPLEVARTLTLLLAPLAPHLAEEFWQRMGNVQSLAYEPWPTFDPDLLVEDEVEMPVQVNGKLRGRIRVAAADDDEAVRAAALADPRVAEWTAGKTVRKVVVVKGKLVSVVVS